MADTRKKILVTGAAGLIGREICQQLITEDVYVVGVDSNWRFPEVIPACDEFLCIDVIEYFKYNSNNFDYIYHMAAINGTAHFYKIPLEVIKNNTLSDLAMFEFAEQNPSCKLIYASSSEVVAGTSQFPTSEERSIFINDIHNARWSYRLPKVLAENYLANSSIDYIIIRFFNVISEACGSGHFIKDITDKIKKQDYTLISPHETRSFCYVADAVNAVIKLSKNADREVINVGSDEEISVIDAADQIALAMIGTTVNWKILNSNPGSVVRRKPDLTKLKTHCPDYKPMPFSQIVEKIYEKNS